MPSIPRIDVAIPTVAAGIPRPPVKMNGREIGDELRAVERKSIHKLVNAPSWKS